MGSNRTIHFYRLQPQTGQRIRYRMELDQRNTVISETVADEPRARTELPGRSIVEDVPRDSAVAQARSAHLAALASRGIQFDVKEDGSISLKHVPPLEQSIQSFYIEGVPCFFEGCEELRKEWAEFLSANGGDDPDCPDCVKGQLMEQFRPRIEPLISRHLNENPPSQIRQLPGSGD